MATNIRGKIVEISIPTLFHLTAILKWIWNIAISIGMLTAPAIYLHYVEIWQNFCPVAAEVTR